MNFGQILAQLLNGRTITCPELGPGMQLGIQAPTGKINKPFIYQQNADNGECIPWAPTQAVVMSNGWTLVTEGTGIGATEAVREHAGHRG